MRLEKDEIGGKNPLYRHLVLFVSEKERKRRKEANKQGRKEGRKRTGEKEREEGRREEEREERKEDREEVGRRVERRKGKKSHQSGILELQLKSFSLVIHFGQVAQCNYSKAKYTCILALKSYVI